MIYDVFLYAGEDDVVAIRQAELERLGVTHVAVQGDRTFQGAPRERIRPPKGVRNSLVYGPDHPATDPWDRERYQRNSMRNAIMDAQPDDVVIIADADEIPNAQAVIYGLERLESEPETIVVLRDFTYYLTLDTRVAEDDRDVYPVMLHVWQLREIGSQRARYARALEATTLRRWEIEEPRGWHFSYLGGPDAVVRKLRSFAHSEYAHLNEADVRRWVAQNRNPYTGEDTLRYEPIGEGTHPRCIVEDPDRWRHLLREPSGKEHYERTGDV